MFRSTDDFDSYMTGVLRSAWHDAWFVLLPIIVIVGSLLTLAIGIMIEKCILLLGEDGAEIIHVFAFGILFWLGLFKIILK